MKYLNYRYIIFQIFAVIMYICNMKSESVLITDKEVYLAFDPITMLVYVAVMLTVAYLTRPNIPKRKPTGLEQFDVPTAEEGRPIQVLFGKKYVMSSNVVWYGHLKTQKIKG